MERPDAIIQGKLCKSIYTPVDVHFNLCMNSRNARASNGSLGKELLTVLVPTVGSTWLIISICGYLWLRNRGEKGKDKASIKTEGRMDPLFRIRLGVLAVGTSSAEELDLL
ncbi:hypothetical protein NC651_026366 [Populus alba x Populus x berolinensis]|nr:hypothetical protein NC651_026366 [Populus alba x Populus x berolinensis]